MNNKRKPMVVFFLSFLMILGLTILRDLFKTNVLGILGVSFVLAMMAPMLALWWWRYKESLKDSINLDDFSLDILKKQEITNVVKKFAEQTSILAPQIYVILSKEEFAYTYQTYERQGVIKVSSEALKVWNLKVIEGVLAHEFCHLENRDSLKGLGRMSVAVFISSIIFFFVKDAIGYILPMFFIMETFKIRDRELSADLRAAELTSVDAVLNYMIDAKFVRDEFLLNQKIKIKEVLTWKWFKVKDKVLALLKLFSFSAVNYALDNFSTYPSWEKRIKVILESKGIVLTGSELKSVIRDLNGSKIGRGSINLNSSPILRSYNLN